MPGALAGHRIERRGPESNRRIGVLQTPALPLGYRAEESASYFSISPFSSKMAVDTTRDPTDENQPDGGRRIVRGPVDTRGWSQLFWDLLFGAIRGIGGIAKNFYATFGIFLLAGAILAVTGTYAFAKFAGHVRSGSTQAFDDAVLRWMGQHRFPSLQPVILEITMLGTGTVVMMIVGVSALFLWLTKHRYSALLLVIATAGAILLNNLLKLGFGRPRPQVFDWATNAVSWSFPSGHAMSATVVYSTVAYLAARLQRRFLHRFLTMLTAALLIIVIGLSRVYLGVHYPSDVIAGMIIGIAWAGFCMATLEAIQLYARNRAPRVLRHEQLAPPHTS
jgi:undecaprenyl-diphosphatase